MTVVFDVVDRTVGGAGLRRRMHDELFGTEQQQARPVGVGHVVGSDIDHRLQVNLRLITLEPRHENSDVGLDPQVAVAGGHDSQFA